MEYLAHHLQALGVQVIVAAPGEQDAIYTHDGLDVRRYAVFRNVANLQDLYGKGDALAARGFARILEEESPDIVHLHAFTRGVSLKLVREAKRRGIPVVFTYHTPTVSCLRGTLMNWGKSVCHGSLDVKRCTACSLHALGMNRVLSIFISNLPSFIPRFINSKNLSGGLLTAFRMKELVALRHSAFLALMEEVDCILVLCHWTKNLLMRNSVPSEKIILCYHGLPYNVQQNPSNLRTMNNLNRNSQLKIAFLGRLDHTKGADLLIRAVRSLPEISIELDLYGIVQDIGNTQYLQYLKNLAKGDSRIRFLAPVPSSDMVSTLAGYHAIAVPSRCIETGPLVVLEAFAAGVPVLGSNLGGIAEKVEHGVNGLLVDVDSIEGWKETIKRLFEDRSILERLRHGIRPPRGIDEVAGEMISLYKKVLIRT